MRKSNQLPERVPLRLVPYLSNAIAKNDGEIPYETVADYDILLMSQRITNVELLQDDDGYYIKATEVYRLVK